MVAEVIEDVDWSQITEGTNIDAVWDAWKMEFITITSTLALHVLIGRQKASTEIRSQGCVNQWTCQICFKASRIL